MTSTGTKRPSRFGLGLAAATLAVLTFPLALYAIQALFSRYLADDFCFAMLAPEHGFFGAQTYWYTAWQGRFMATLALTIASYLGSGGAVLLPLLVLTSWIASGIWAYNRFLQRLGLEPALLPAAIGIALTVYTTLDRSPLFENLLWETGLLTYTVPFVFGMLLFGITVNEIPHPKSGLPALAAAALLSVMIAGFHEVIGLILFTILLETLAVVLYLRRFRKNRWNLPFVTAALLGAALGLALVVAAPGNQVRAGMFPHPANILEWVRIVADSLRTYAVVFFWWTRPDTALAIIPALLVLIFPFRKFPAWSFRNAAKWVALLTASAVPIAVAAVAPSAYAQSAFPPLRALITSTFVFECIVMFSSLAVGVALRQYLKPGLLADRRIQVGMVALAAAVLVWGPLHSSVALASHVPALQSDAAQWDRRDVALRQAAANGQMDASAWSLGTRETISDITSDPNYGPNRCTASYYHLRSVRASVSPAP